VEYHLASPSAPQLREHPTTACPGGTREAVLCHGLHAPPVRGLCGPWGLLLWWEPLQEQELQCLLGETWWLSGSEESADREAVVKISVPMLQQSRWEAGGEQILSKEIFLQ